MEKEWMSLPEGAEYLGISLATIYRWLNEGRIPSYKAGRVRRVKKTDLDSYMESGREEEKA